MWQDETDHAQLQVSYLSCSYPIPMVYFTAPKAYEEGLLLSKDKSSVACY